MSEKIIPEIGDKVRIVNYGYIYPLYEEMFKLMGFNNIRINDSIDDEHEGVIEGIVFATMEHPMDKTILYGINLDNCDQILIETAGLKLI